MPKPGPLCRCCGKSIPKRTITYHVMEPDSVQSISESPFWKTVRPPHRLTSKAECQRYTNHPIVSVRYSDYKGRHVTSFSAWDGESYEDPFFCNGTCARDFAYLMARGGLCTTTYEKAVEKRRGNPE